MIDIKDCSLVIKCDVDGCHNKADKGVVFDGVTPQYYVCSKCLKELYEVLKKQFEKENKGVKNSKR